MKPIKQRFCDLCRRKTEHYVIDSGVVICSHCADNCWLDLAPDYEDVAAFVRYEAGVSRDRAHILIS